jgi:hypothetical protein
MCTTSSTRTRTGRYDRYSSLFLEERDRYSSDFSLTTVEREDIAGSDIGKEIDYDLYNI